MSNRPNTYQYGDAKPVFAPPTQSAVVIERGDLVAQAPGAVTGATSAASITAGQPYPAADQPWDTDLATTQEAFHDAFLGVAAQYKPAGQTGSGTSNTGTRVNTGGVHKFTCASATFALGALVGPAKQSGNLLENQKVVGGVAANLAIGRVARAYTSAVTEVFVEVFSVVMAGGVQSPM